MEQVILVDSEDNEIGLMEKMEAHRKGVLHRAFSVLLFNSKGEMLIQKRASSKYHSGGLWSNACCSHPRPGELMEDATQRRIREELGVISVPRFLYKFQYQKALDNNLIEHELDHVYAGVFDGVPSPDKNEVEEITFINPQELLVDITRNPHNYTFWLALIAKRYQKHF